MYIIVITIAPGAKDLTSSNSFETLFMYMKNYVSLVLALSGFLAIN